MATASPKLPPMPSQDVPAIDPVTGKWTVPWFQYMKALEIVVRQVRSEIP